MPFASREDIVHEFLARALALHDDPAERPDWPQVAAIGRSLGMQDREIDAVREAAQDYYTRGCDLRKAGRLDEAIAELRIAAAIDPGNTIVVLALAEAHAQRWRERNDEEDRELSERLVNRCAAADSSHAPLAAFMEAARATSGTSGFTRTSANAAMLATAGKVVTGRRVILYVVLAWVVILLAIAVIFITGIFRAVSAPLPRSAGSISCVYRAA